MAKTTVTKITGTTGSEQFQLGGIASGYTSSELHIVQAAVQTTDATVTTLWSLSLAEGESVVIHGFLLAPNSTFAQAIGGTFAAVFRRASGGNVTLVGSVDTSVKEDSGGAPTYTLDADTTNQLARLRVTGEAATTYNWVASVFYHKVLTSS